MSLEAGGVVATVGGTKTIAGGTKGTTADASLSYPIALTPRLTLIPTIGTTWATTLLGNVKESPIVFHTNAQPAGFVSLSYRFGS